MVTDQVTLLSAAVCPILCYKKQVVCTDYGRAGIGTHTPFPFGPESFKDYIYFPLIDRRDHFCLDSARWDSLIRQWGHSLQIVEKLVYAQSGERKTNFRLPNTFAQFIRNAAYRTGFESSQDYPNITWTLNGNGLWSNAANWSGNAVPSACNNVIIDLPVQLEVQLTANNTLEFNSLILGSNNHFFIPSTTILTISNQ